MATWLWPLLGALIYEPEREKRTFWHVQPSVHPRSLIKFFIVRRKNYLFFAIQNVPSEYSYQTAQADLNLRWTRMSEGTFSDVAAPIFEPAHDKTNKLACAPSEDSDQPGHPPSLIRAFAMRLMGR